METGRRGGRRPLSRTRALARLPALCLACALLSGWACAGDARAGGEEAPEGAKKVQASLEVSRTEGRLLARPTAKKCGDYRLSESGSAFSGMGAATPRAMGARPSAATLPPPRGGTAGKGASRAPAAPGVRISVWNGGGAMDRTALRATIAAVTRTLTPDGRWCAPGVTALLMETAAVESGLGEVVRQRGGPALSPWQLQASALLEVLRHFRKADPGLLARAMAFYDRRMPPVWNRERNVPWNAAMSLLYYARATGGRFIGRLATLDERARLWKERYNTRLGRGTVAGYRRRALSLVYGNAARAPRMAAR